MAAKAGWRKVHKRYVPHLEESHKMDRLTFAAKHKKNKFNEWVDIDEKWFRAIMRLIIILVLS